MYYKIYALKNPSFAKPYIKIGLTKNVERRIKDLSVATPTPFELVFSLRTGCSGQSGCLGLHIHQCAYSEHAHDDGCSAVDKNSCQFVAICALFYFEKLLVMHK